MWIVFSLLAAVSAAIVVTLSKIGVKNIESSLAFAVQSVLIVGVAWGVVAWQGHLGQVQTIDRRTWLFLIAAGVITCLSSLFSFQALKLGMASRTASFDKISLVFSILLAVFFLKEKVTWQLVAGAVLMAGGAILIAFSGGEEGSGGE
ncbi:EamA family transporter [Hymenobacter psychrophilus]|uniref:Transporter family protein n=1 Tax=Hymenobacter psychrophilus TaxID=651662 RepID=A0A1H3AZ01_9BACT|nr:EamA family transporter [Hymenobacter psychrophilus]SDX34344.1 transporter family protein [Hymenobacter psychrophilus]